MTEGPDARAGGKGGRETRRPEHLLYAGGKEFFAGFLEELLLSLGDQVLADLGDETWGLEGGRGEVPSVREGAGRLLGTGMGVRGGGGAERW